MKRGSAFNGDRLKSARLYRGLTVAELADKVGLQRQTISMYENNKLNNPELATITNISNVLGFPKKYFIEKDDIQVGAGTTYFRALLTTSKKYRSGQIERVKLLSKVYYYLSEYVEFPVIRLPKGVYASPEDAANNLRGYWGLGDKPIENIVYLVEENGLIVTMFDTENDDIDAFSQLVNFGDENKYLIGYSKNKSTAARVHFDIAHELGHIMLHSWDEDLEEVDKEEFKKKEREAHAFASAFLLPKQAFINDVGRYADSLAFYIELKKKWKVSISAMIRRSYNLGLIDNNEYQQLMRNMQKKGIKKFEPLDDKLFTAQPSLLKTSVQMLLEEGVVTPKEFLEELSQDYGLSLDGNEIERLLDLPKDTLKVVNIAPIHNIRFKNKS